MDAQQVGGLLHLSAGKVRVNNRQWQLKLSWQFCCLNIICNYKQCIKVSSCKIFTNKSLETWKKHGWDWEHCNNKLAYIMKKRRPYTDCNLLGRPVSPASWRILAKVFFRGLNLYAAVPCCCQYPFAGVSEVGVTCHFHGHLFSTAIQRVKLPHFWKVAETTAIWHRWWGGVASCGANMLMVMSTGSKKVVFPRHGDSIKQKLWRWQEEGGKRKEPKMKDRDTLVKRGKRECELCVTEWEGIR